MRVQQCSTGDETIKQRLQEFASYLLDVGNGLIPIVEGTEFDIKLPGLMCQPVDTVDAISKMIKWVYPNMKQKFAILDSFTASKEEKNSRRMALRAMLACTKASNSG
eukprot:6176660-Pleurochrysis_carterae.AAC.1